MKRLGIELVAFYFIARNLRDELQNFSVLSQVTYWLYQLHWASLQAG